MTTLDDVDALSGLCNGAVGRVLYRLAAEVPADQAIVEIGSYRGKSTAYLALGALDGNGSRVYAVDPWDTDGNPTGRFGFAEHATRLAFDAQLERVGLRFLVAQRQGFSVDVATTYNGPPVGMLFIDGHHTEHAVTADFYAWAPHLVSGGRVTFDDIDTVSNPGVRVAVDAITNRGDLWDLRIEAKRLAIGLAP